VLGVEMRWGVVGLTISAGLAGWLEFALLRRTLSARIGRTGLAASFVSKLWIAAGIAAVAGWAGKLIMGLEHPIPMALVSLGLYGCTYFGATAIFRVPEAGGLIRRAASFVGLRRDSNAPS